MRLLLAFTLFVATARAASVSVPLLPKEHPRLYLRAAQAADLRARLASPALAGEVATLRQLAAKSTAYRLEWEALQHFAAPDEARDRALIRDTLEFLRATTLPRVQDGARLTGRAMVTGAIVYDWLYPLFTPADRQAYITELVRLAKTLECGYPPTRQSSVTGHSSEAMFQRDLLSAGIAIADEFPEMYRLTAERLFGEHVPVRNWFYPGGAHHQGDSYGPYRFGWDTFPLFIFHRLGAGNIYDPAQRFVPYYWLYATRPDGQRLRSGDTYLDKNSRTRPWADGIGTLLVASYYHDPILMGRALRLDQIREGEALFAFLWRDLSVPPQPATSLPLSRYFGSPFGWTIARTSWGDDAAIAEMKINEYNFANHQHLDAGAFQLYYRGALALDSGRYEGGSDHAYGSAHTKNYSWRSIAHNTLLVYDPAEKFAGGYANDGGQRLPNNNRSEPRHLVSLLDPARGYRTGHVIAHGFGPDAITPDYTLLEGDITAAYSPKVRHISRSFVFVNLHDPAIPAALIVLDRVDSADPGFHKTWLLHSEEEPRIERAAAVIDRTGNDSRGRLRLDVLCPANDDLEVNKIGGPGHEFWVSGRNEGSAADAKTAARSALESGAWRIELSPKRPARENLFLTVMQVSDRTANAAPYPVRRIEAPGRVGCVLAGATAAWVVCLRPDQARSAEPVLLQIDAPVAVQVLVTDLAAGIWTARRASSDEARAIKVDAEAGAAWFTGAPGTWTLTKQ